MSLILALDTSTDACSVSLNANGKLHSLFEVAAKSHTQRLLPMVDDVLSAAGCELDDLDAIAFGRGPGSFTGLRICAGIVQGLAFGANLPVIPVSTLEAMAVRYYRSHRQMNLPVLVALDARMEEVYWAMYSNEPGHVIPLSNEAVMSPGRVADDHQFGTLNGNFVGLGPGFHYAAMQALGASRCEMDAHPHAEDMALIAAGRLASGDTVSALEAQPVYLRDSVSWQKRQRIRPLSST